MVTQIKLSCGILSNGIISFCKNRKSKCKIASKPLSLTRCEILVHVQLLLVNISKLLAQEIFMRFPAGPRFWLASLMSIVISKQNGQVLRNLSFMQHPGSLLRHGKSEKAKALPPSLLLPHQLGHLLDPSSLITDFPISTLAFLHHSLRGTPHMAVRVILSIFN